MNGDRAEELLAALNVDEKAALSAGSGPWHTTSVDRLGIGALKLTDGSNGARGERFHGTQSACFPCGSALGATWNPALVREVAAALAEEVRSKGAHVLLAPTLNLHRSPLAGRNFECFGEDPHIVSRMAAQYVRGLQDNGVGAVAKHFVCNDAETARESVDCIVDERTLREVYFQPFHTAVCEAGVWAVMTAYNRLNGTYCSEHDWLVRQLLIGEWGFDGVIVSDWGGTRSTVESANAGLGLEMPGPATHLGPKLADEVRAGRVSVDTTTDIARRLLTLGGRTGSLDAPPAAERSVDRPEHRRIAAAAATESIVLLHNDDTLPLDRAALESLAVIGPNAEPTQIQGGGSTHVNPHYHLSTVDGIRNAVPGVDVRHSEGCSLSRYTRPLDTRLLTDPEGRPGARLEYFRGTGGTHELIHSEHVDTTHLVWIGAPLDHVPLEETVIHCVATLCPQETGDHLFGLTASGDVTVYLDGILMLDSTVALGHGPHFFGRSTDEIRVEARLEAGRTYDLRVELRPWVEQSATVGARLGCLAPRPADTVAEAVALARECDAAVVVVGTNDEWELEGGDRPDLSLPGRQRELIGRVAEVNSRTIVVVNSGAAVETDWCTEVAATLMTWFGGQEQGNAVAVVLFGDAEPSGRLPVTLPAKGCDALPIGFRDVRGGEIPYSEGLFIGYRHFDRWEIEPGFPFGHGLSYSRFSYGDLQVDRDVCGPADTVVARVEVRNVGDRNGAQVVQLYVRDVAASLPRPEQELKGFRKIVLDPGESTIVEFPVGPDEFTYWDPEPGQWVVEPGDFDLAVGTSSRDLRSRQRVRVSGQSATPVHAGQVLGGDQEWQQP